MSDDLLYKSVIELKKLLTDKQVSAKELTELALKRIDETNDKTNAFLYVAGDTAIEEAEGINANTVQTGIQTAQTDLAYTKTIQNNSP